MEESERDNKKPTQVKPKQPEKTIASSPAHPEQAVKTALDITLQKAREIREKYSDEEPPREDSISKTSIKKM